MIWVQTVFNGIFLGALYGLLGLGLALVFGVVRIVNIAHGEFIVLTAFLALGLADLFPGIPPLIMLVPVVAIAAGGGYLLQGVLINRVVKSPDPTVPMLFAFGLSFALRNVSSRCKPFAATTRSKSPASASSLPISSSSILGNCE